MKFPVVEHMVSVFLHATTTAAVLAFKAFARLAGTLVVLALGACTILLMLPDLWCLVLHAHRLAAAVQAWRDSGPHNSLLGRVRAHLAAAGLLAAPRDPLADCGVPFGEGWRQILQLMLLPDGRDACLERQVQLAWEEHLAFTASLFLAAECLGLLLALCMLGWACSRLQHPEGTGDDVPPDEGQEGEDAAPPDVAEEGEDTAPPDAAEEGEDTDPPDAAEEGEDTDPQEAAEEGEAALGGQAHPQTPADPGRGEEQKAGRREVRHSLHVPPYLRERLAGPQGCFLEYLRRRHNILVFMDAARRRMHLKGAKEDVVLCHGTVRALLAQWRRHHTAAPE